MARSRTPLSVSAGGASSSLRACVAQRLLKHENVFYHVEKRDLLKPFRNESENIGHFCHNSRLMFF
jgi:hypothetical protein